MEEKRKCEKRNRVTVTGMVTIIVTVKKSILLLSDAEVRGISVSFPVSKSNIEFRVLPVDRKNSFAFKLFTEDGEVAWCIGTTDTTVILRAVLVMVPGGTTVATDEVVIGVSGYDGDMGCCGGRRGRRAFTIAVGKVGGGRSGGMCDSCSTGVSRRAPTMRSSEGVCWFVKWRSRFLQHLQCSHRRKRHSA
jgi:hypothetical protein